MRIGITHSEKEDAFADWFKDWDRLLALVDLFCTT